MASTNKTTHYNLSQYIGTDKPTYLVDYNTDMSSIDTGIYNAQSKANTNESAIGNLSNLETSVKTDLVSAINEEKGKTDKIGNLSNLTTSANTDLVVAINEVDAEADANNQNIGTMTNLETTVKTSLVGAVNEVNTKATTNTNNIETLDTQFIAFENKFNLTNFKNYSNATSSDLDITLGTGASVSRTNLSIATNSDGSIFKFYGELRVTGSATLTFKNTGINPTSAFNVSGAGIQFQYSTIEMFKLDFDVLSNGNIQVTISSDRVEERRCYLSPCLYFAKDFGDTPID